MQFPCDNCKITNINRIFNEVDMCENCTLVDEYNHWEEKKHRNEKLKRYKKPIIEAKLKDIFL